MYRQALAMALEMRAAPDTLQALAGLAVYFERAGRHASALALAAHVLAEPGGRSETVAHTRQLYEALRAQFPHDQAQQIEAHGCSQPLSVLVAE